jgi:hypothetical protein
MKDLQLHAEVGPDGILDLQVPLGKSEANAAVIVTIQFASSAQSEDELARLPWSEFLNRTYGSCRALDLEEPHDLPLPPWKN